MNQALIWIHRRLANGSASSQNVKTLRLPSHKLASFAPHEQHHRGKQKQTRHTQIDKVSLTGPPPIPLAPTHHSGTRSMRKVPASRKLRVQLPVKEETKMKKKGLSDKFSTPGVFFDTLILEPLFVYLLRYT